MVMDLKSAFVRICDLFNADELHRNWLIYVEEEKHRIIIEHVTATSSNGFSDPAGSQTIEDVLFDFKEEPLFEHPPLEGSASGVSAATEVLDDQPTVTISLPVTPVENGDDGAVVKEHDVSTEVVEKEDVENKPTTRSSSNKDYALRAGKFVCLTCGESFPNPKSVRKHLMKGSCFPFVCLTCGTKFDDEQSLTNHVPLCQSPSLEAPSTIVATTADSTTVDDDDDDDDDLNDSDEDVNDAFLQKDDIKGKETCLHCGKVLSCPRALKRHVDSKHFGHGKVYSCPECGKDYKCRSKMREHMSKDHPDSDLANKLYPCPICGKEFKASLKMKEHLNRMHTSLTKTCRICNKNFKQIYSLEYHMDIVHPDVPNPFADGESHLCDNCGASFSTKGSLNLHRYTRHVEPDKHDERKMKRRLQSAEKRKLGLVKPSKPKPKREFVCGICGKVFTSHNCMLKQHIAIVHEGKRFPCEICGAEFTTPDKKRVHIGNIHKGIKHKCEYCGRDFTLKDTLKTHINAVHKKIKHRCDICSQEFSIIQDMRQHIKAVHQGIKSKCEFCGKDFNRPQEMKRHQRKVHQDQLMMSLGPKIEIPIPAHHIILATTADGQTITETITQTLTSL